MGSRRGRIQNDVRHDLARKYRGGMSTLGGVKGSRALFLLILAVFCAPCGCTVRSCFAAAACPGANGMTAETAYLHFFKPRVCNSRRLRHETISLLSVRRGGRENGRQRCSMAARETPAVRSMADGSQRFSGDGVHTACPDGTITRYDAAERKGEGSCSVPWTHFLEIAALRCVEVSPVEGKLAKWRAGSLAAHAAQKDCVEDAVSFQIRKQQVLNGMRWERVLAAEIGVGLKLSLWKSQARARRMQTDWSVRNAILSLDFERNAAHVEVSGRDVANQAQVAMPSEPARGRRNSTRVGRGDQMKGRKEYMGSHGRKQSNKARDRIGSSYHLRCGLERERITVYVKEMTRTEEYNALFAGKRLLQLMHYEGVSPNTIFFNALLGACTGKSVAKGVGFDGRRGRSKGTLIPPARGAAFTVRRRASTGAARARTAAGRAAHKRWNDCSAALRLMQRHGVVPDIASLNILVDACVKQGGMGKCQVQHIEDAIRILDAFSKSCSIMPDVVTYTSLISGCAKALRDCRPQGGGGMPAPGDATTADGAGRAERVIEMASRIFDRMVADRMTPNAVTCTAALDLGVHLILRSRQGSRSQLHARVLCQHIIVVMRSQLKGSDGSLQRQHGRLLTYALNVVLRALFGQHEREVGAEGEVLALEVVDLLLDEGAAPDIITYNTLLHRLVHSFKRQDQWRDSDMGRQFRESSAGRPGRQVWRLAAQPCDGMQVLHSAKQLLSKMHEHRVSPDVATYTTLVNICALGAPHRSSFVDCTRLICSAMRCAKIKPNTATSTAFAAGLLTSSYVKMCKDGEREDAQKEVHPGEREDALKDVQQAHHATCLAAASKPDQMKRFSGPRAAEVLRAMLALGMRPDSSTASALVRAAAAAGGADDWARRNLNEVTECVRLIEAMRGAGAVACLDWYLQAVAAAGCVTEGLYVAYLSEEHLSDPGARRLVCQTLVRNLCRRRGFDGIVQGWTVVLSQHAAGQPLPLESCTLLLEAARREGSATSARLSLDLVAAVVDDDSGGKDGSLLELERARKGLVDVLQSAGESCAKLNGKR